MLYWISTERMTVGVITASSGLIVEAAPIIHRFVHQPLGNLIRWMQRQPGFRLSKIGQVNGPQ